ncbi:MAG: helix-turn-helix transcriptional regulator [Clostridia bacterium]|nr:helix-turn-helix transcriptional regulator [Clostridia bacterium]
MEDENQTVSSDLIRGHINTIILRALYDGDKYGYEIISEIEHKSHGQYTLKQPSLYSALKRLEKEGFITSYWGGSVSGGRRKYFSLTDAGRKISEQNQSEWEYSRTVIDSLISDKDFDFSNPAPLAVDMRVLRDTTTRAHSQEKDEEDSFGLSFSGQEQLLSELKEKQAELDRRQAELEAESARITQERLEFSKLREAHDSLDEERTVFAESATQLEAAREALEQDMAQFAQEKAKYEAEMLARNDALLRERAWREHEIAERERKLAEERKRLDENKNQINADEFRALDERLKENEEALNAQRASYEEQIRLRDSWLEEEQTRHAEEMEKREKEIVEEQEALFRQREQQLLHQNYLGLINTPPSDKSSTEYNYYTAPVGDEEPEDTTPVDTQDEDEWEYRSVVRKIYANSINSESTQTPESERATSLDGIDFYDLEERAEKDGIRIVTAGGKGKTELEQTSQSVIHRGKALFVSAMAFFVFCAVLGIILLAIQSSAPLPVFYPYLIWGIGLIVLLICGLAYANKYGERSLRRTTPAIVHAVVLFLILVIIAAIIALWVRIDFTDINAIATYIIVPDVFFLGVIVFGLTYYLQVRPARY